MSTATRSTPLACLLLQRCEIGRRRQNHAGPAGSHTHQPTKCAWLTSTFRVRTNTHDNPDGLSGDGPNRSIGELVDLDPHIRIQARQAFDEGTNESEGSAWCIFDSDPDNRPNFVYEDVWVLGRRPILHSEAGRSELIRDSPRPVGDPSYRIRARTLATLNGFRDDRGANREIL